MATWMEKAAEALLRKFRVARSETSCRRAPVTADEIARIIASHAAGEWVSVSERLPEALPSHWSKDVLVLTESGAVDIDACYHGPTTRVWREWGRIGRVIYWRELPPPPTKSQATGASATETTPRV